MKPSFKEQLQEEMEILWQLLNESTDKKQQESIIKMLAELTKYLNKGDR